MGETKRRSYTGAFKAKVGLEAIRGVKTVNEIGQAYGVHPAQVGAVEERDPGAGGDAL
jgi:transposase-like protein